jgi:glycosyltransferase involved in cell wall biosynthesis
MLKIAIVANKVSPYRSPVFERIGQTPGVGLQVIFCSRREPNRQWNLPMLNFEHAFLRERISTVNGRYIHNNPDVIPALNRFLPDVVVTGGFSPTHLYAFAYALVRKAAHVPMTDGTYLSEQALTRAHTIVRRSVYARSRAFISASAGGRRLYESYGIAAERCFKSCLCIDNGAFFPDAHQERRQFDFVFCGRIEEVKNPLFALDVALEVARRLRRKVSILYVGAGNLEESVRTAALRQSDFVQTEFHGFAAQEELPALYRSARVFLFPTLADSWGVVANEACAAGLPVMVSPHAGVAGELVLDGENGFICELNVDVWADRAALLLTQQDIWQKFSECSLSRVRDYTFDNAASGLLEACRFSAPAREPRKLDRPI